MPTIARNVEQHIVNGITVVSLINSLNDILSTDSCYPVLDDENDGENDGQSDDISDEKCHTTILVKFTVILIVILTVIFTVKDWVYIFSSVVVV